jgi:hypothetical protein
MTVGPTGLHRVLERRRDAEVAAAATDRPEEVRMLGGADVPHAAVGHDELGGAEVVEGEAVLRHQPAETAAEREPRDARRAHDATGCGESMYLCLAIELLPQHAALRARRALARIDVNALHRREVDHQAVIDGGAAGDVVPAAADGDLQAERARELHGVDDVGRPVAARDEGRPPVDEPVVHAAGVVVTDVVPLQELARERRRELGDRIGERHPAPPELTSA